MERGLKTEQVNVFPLFFFLRVGKNIKLHKDFYLTIIAAFSVHAQGSHCGTANSMSQSRLKSVLAWFAGSGSFGEAAALGLNKPWLCCHDRHFLLLLGRKF